MMAVYLWGSESQQLFRRVHAESNTAGPEELRRCDSSESPRSSLMAWGPTAATATAERDLDKNCEVTYFHDATSNDHLLSRLIPTSALVLGHVEI